jgi:hypothetical protein
LQVVEEEEVLLVEAVEVVGLYIMRHFLLLLEVMK